MATPIFVDFDAELLQEHEKQFVLKCQRRMFWALLMLLALLVIALFMVGWISGIVIAATQGEWATALCLSGIACPTLVLLLLILLGTARTVCRRRVEFDLERGTGRLVHVPLFGVEFKLRHIEAVTVLSGDHGGYVGLRFVPRGRPILQICRISVHRGLTIFSPRDPVQQVHERLHALAQSVAELLSVPITEEAPPFGRHHLDWR